jgi:hypothetical protein
MSMFPVVIASQIVTDLMRGRLGEPVPDERRRRPTRRRRPHS